MQVGLEDSALESLETRREASCAIFSSLHSSILSIFRRSRILSPLRYVRELAPFLHPLTSSAEQRRTPHTSVSLGREMFSSLSLCFYTPVSVKIDANISSTLN